jgi:hypothetical protein
VARGPGARELELARRTFFLILLSITMMMGNWSSTAADENPDSDSVIPSGDMIDATHGEPADWERVSQRFLNSEQVARTFTSAYIAGNPLELRLTNGKSNVVHWDRRLTLPAGTYNLSGEMRTENLDPMFDSATIGVSAGKSTFGSSFSPPDHSTQWQKGGLYFKIGKGPRRVKITCRLEGRGTASFRRVELTRLSNPPAAGATLVNLDDSPEPDEFIAPRPYDAPIGRPWTVFATMFLLAAISLAGWIALRPRQAS